MANANPERKSRESLVASQSYLCSSFTLVFPDSERELRIWKRIVRGTLGDKVFATLETLVERELAKEEKAGNA